MDGAQSEDASVSSPKEEASTISLRILSPSFEPNQRLSFDKLSPSTTVGEVKNLIVPLAPNHPTPDQQRLIYRGRPLLNDSATLQTVLEPPLDAVHTLHLVLPPGPEISNNIYVSSDSGLRYRHPPGRSPNLNAHHYTDPVATATGLQAPGQTSTLPPLPALNNPATQTATPITAGQQPNGEAMRQVLEQHRRRAEELNLVVDRARALINTHTTRLRIQGINIPLGDNLGQAHRPSLDSSAAPPPGTSIQAPNSHAIGTDNFINNAVSQSLVLARITSQIMLFELEIERGITPSIDSIAAVRNQLYAILDARYRQPPSSPSGIEVEGLLSRLQNVTARAYQLRQLEHIRTLSAANTSRIESNPQTTQSSEYYLITTPSGEQMMLTPPPSTVQTSPETVLVFPDRQPVRNDVDPLGVMNNDVLHNVVRQAVLNQQPVRNNNNDQFAQNVRRFWLFLRLYFFCYLFTDSNTWERYLFVGLAALIALFSESNITSRLFSIIVHPIQRHLEGLIHGEPPARTEQSNDTNNDNVDNNQPGQNRAAAAGQQGFRRIERAFALFIASLIPGLGERQVEVAAEEAARNAREQEQARIDEENAQNEGQAEGDPAVDQGEVPPAVAEATGNAEVPQQQQQQIQQE
ncbi:conserved fungal protein [Talaromyces stipitatus ATCC 10500]|uniref:Conserved fungal protein n=1 Tax=Talaromyces stipitatus (strain ATCC 10500 / CBS 375.48 / QM 6759 / NRRL 1006) TaxID=441959 RepID=B8M1Y3_TALSN|nr:uncharacterized protein TSTA_085920 [Talaromyces stipitatus ATCC 10500]EED21361.1 conserved fungal protein [Talaromyces stipitatus ATCC 10500]